MASTMNDCSNKCKWFVVQKLKIRKSKLIDFLLIFGVLTSLSAIFQVYYGDHFSGGGSRNTRGEPPSLGK
jgi:hypothetical protein